MCLGPQHRMFSNNSIILCYLCLVLGTTIETMLFIKQGRDIIVCRNREHYVHFGAYPLFMSKVWKISCIQNVNLYWR